MDSTFLQVIGWIVLGWIALSLLTTMALTAFLRAGRRRQTLCVVERTVWIEEMRRAA